MVEEHFSRNSRVVKGLYEWKFIEELGLGIDRIYSLMQEEGHPLPEFKADEKTVVVTLRRGVGIVPPLRFAPEEGSRLNERQVKAIQYLQAVRTHHQPRTPRPLPRRLRRKRCAWTWPTWSTRARC